MTPTDDVTKLADAVLEANQPTVYCKLCRQIGFCTCTHGKPKWVEYDDKGMAQNRALATAAKKVVQHQAAEIGSGPTPEYLATLSENTQRYIQQLRAENERLRATLDMAIGRNEQTLAEANVILLQRVAELETQYQELWCAVWVCPPNEFEAGEHADAVKEAELGAKALVDSRDSNAN